MRVHHSHLRGLADLVASNPGLPFWPSADGMGDLADLVASNPGLPFWPSGSGMGDLVYSGYPIAYLDNIPGMWPEPGATGFGDLVHSSPGLPFWASGTGMGCGCGGTCGCGGMGALTDDLSSMFTNLTSGNFSVAWTNFTTALTEPVIGPVQVWMLAAGAIAALMVFQKKRGRR